MGHDALIDIGADIAHARQCLEGIDHRPAHDRDLARRRIAELDIHAQITPIDPDVAGRLRGHEILAGIGIHDGGKGRIHLFDRDGHACSSDGLRLPELTFMIGTKTRQPCKKEARAVYPKALTPLK